MTFARFCESPRPSFQMASSILAKSRLMRASSASRCSRFWSFLRASSPNSDHLLDRGTVFAFQGENQVESLLHFPQPLGINLHFVQVMRQAPLEFAPRCHGLLVLLQQAPGGGIHFLQSCKRSPHQTGLVH